MNRILVRLKGWYWTLRRELLRRFCRFLVSSSTLQAQWYLRKRGPIRVLVDNSVLAHSITHETARILEIAKWGPYEINAVNAARIPIHSPANNSRTYREIRYLAGIAHLARLGHLQLFTSAELQAERFRQPPGRFSGYGIFDLGLLNGINMESLDGFKFDLIDPNGAQLKRIASCSDPLYVDLRTLVGQKSSLDAYHIFTAEKFDMFCFLHIDFPLAEKVKQNQAKKPFQRLKTKIFTPSDLGKLIGLLPVDTNLLSYEDASFPVRPDLHRDTQARTRVRRKS